MQLFPLIKKNLLYIKRNKSSTIITFIFPIFFLFLLIAIFKHNEAPTKRKIIPQNELISTFPKKNDKKFGKFYDFALVTKHYQLYNFLSPILENLTSNKSMLAYYNSKEEFNTNKDFDMIFYCDIDQNNVTSFEISSGKMGGDVSFKVRNNDLISLDYLDNSKSMIQRTDFMMNAIFGLLIKQSEKEGLKKTLTIKSSSLGYDKVSFNFYNKFSMYFIPSIFMMSFFSLFFQFVMMMVNEKENKLKDLLYRQGVSLYNYFFSFQVTFILLSLIPMIICTYLYIKYFFFNTSFLVLFFFMFLFLFNFIAIGYLLQMAISTSKSGQTLAKMFFFAITVLSSVVKQPECSPVSKALFIFFPQMLFNISLEIVAVTNSLGINLSFYSKDWGAFNLSYNGYSLTKIFFFYLFDYGIYLLIALGIETVQMSNTDIFTYLKTKYLSTKVQSRHIEFNMKTNQNFGCHQEIDRSHRKIKNKLSIHHLKKYYGDVHAVNDFNCELYSDEIFVLLGHNGAGKTTLINMISGIENSDKGDLLLNGKSIFADRRLLYSNIGLCSQNNTFFPELTVKEHLEIMSSLKGQKPNNKEITDLINQIDLNEKMNQLAKTLSQGQQRRLCIALALIGQSSLVLLDEPTSGMDFKAKKFIWNFLKKYKRDRIILLTTHSLEEAELIHDRIGIMSEGNYICSGTSEFLKNKYSSGININFILNKGYSNETNIMKLFKSLQKINDTIVIKSISTEVFMVNFESVGQNIDALFDFISKKKEDYGIIDYNVSTASLEDVFLKVNNNIISKQLYSELNHISQSSSNGLLTLSLSDDLNQMDLKNDLFVKQNFFKQLLSGIKKNLIYTWRNKGSFLFEIITSLLTMIILVISIVSIVNSYLYYSITLPSFNTRIDDVYYTDMTGKEDNLYTKYFKDTKYPEYPINVKDVYSCIDLAEIIYKQSKYKAEKALIYFTKYTEDEIEFLVLKREDLPEEYMFINNLLLSKYLEFEYGIKTQFVRKFSPKISSNIISVANYYMNNILNFITVTLLVTILVNISGYNMVTPLRERLCNVKQQQFLSGLNSLSYWLSFLIIDTLKLFLFILILLPVIISYLSLSLWSFLFVILCFTVSINLFIYFFSFFVSKEENGQKWYLYVMSIGTIFLPYLGLLWNVAYEKKEKTMKNQDEGIDFVFSGILFDMLPSSSLIMALVKLMIIYFMKQERTGSVKEIIETMNKMENKVLRHHLFATFIQSAVYGILIFLTEKKYLFILFFKLRNYFISKNSSHRIDSFLPRESNEDIENEINNILKNKERLTTKVYKLDKTYYPFFGLLNCFMKKYNVKAVNDLNLGLEKNEKFGLLGSNGSGKTTTFKCLIKEILYDRGSINFFNHDLSKEFNLIRQNLGYCPQENNLFDYLTVNETLSYYAQMKGVKNTPTEIAYKFSLDKYLNHLCINLSGGNKRKLSFAIGIMNNPKIILLDEPSTGVDPESRRVMWKNLTFISKNNAAFNMILSTHSMEEAEVLCDRIGWMEKGNFTHIGNPEVLKMKFSRGYYFHIKFNEEFKTSVGYKENYKNLRNNVLGIKDVFDKYERNNDIWALSFLWDVVKDIQPMCSSIEFVEEMKGNGFDLKINIKEGQKGKVFCYILKLKINQGHKISEISIGLKSLEMIFSDSNVN